MSWTSPKTWSDGSSLTAAELNEQIRDNEIWLKAALTVTGITASASAKSLNSALAGVRVKKTADQTINNTTWTSLTWDSEDFDTADGASSTYHSTSANTDRLTVPSGLDGYYQVQVNLIWDTNTTGVRSLRILLNGSTNIAVARVSAVSGGSYGTGMFSGTLYNLAAGDYVTCEVHQDSGGNRAVDGTSLAEVGFFQMYRVGV